ncbi:MAG: phosphoribosylamine--glycine ligase [Nitrospinae bacterium]|nr:phosphoribosylamine--glycine ligase [Nitrospinota bacterium]
MKVLVIGGGGREHSLVWKIHQSPKVSKVYCAPGNGGTQKIAENVDIKADDINTLARFAEEEGIDLTVVGPELPLTLGIVDEFEGRGLKIFGPNKKGAEIEGSKGFTKDLLKRYGIPIPRYAIFDSPDDAKRYIKEIGAPMVVKADGLTGGKGVIICHKEKEAIKAIDLIMEERVFGKAGDRVVIEEFMEGEEVSFMVFTDGEKILPMVSSQDHKRIYDGDKGTNTGGMGAYSPAPIVTSDIFREIMDRIMTPTITGMAKEGRPYKGVLYAGLMISEGSPNVLEFNARFGDPETQPILARMESDIIPIIEGVIDGDINKVEDIRWKEGASVCVVMASEGYPRSYQKGKRIEGLEAAERLEGVKIFHAGTRLSQGNLVTDGGRVLGVTALGMDIKDAIEKAYRAVSLIHWEGVYYRRDIGRRAL